MYFYIADSGRVQEAVPAEAIPSLGIGKIVAGPFRASSIQCKHTVVEQRGSSMWCVYCHERLGWHCPPTGGVCRYDNGDLDHCDFCGQPEERK